MINRMHSATVFVNDQDEALDFYVNTLGFEKLEDAPFNEGDRWLTVVPPGSPTALALMKPNGMGEDTAAKVGTYSGITFMTSDIDGTYEALSAKGVQFTSPPEQMPWGIKATWLRDPDGNSYFLSEE